MTSYEYMPPMQYEVFCHVCSHKYLEQDPAVTFIHGDHVWECTDPGACALNRAMNALDPERSIEP